MKNININDIINELKNRINVSNTLPEQQLALQQFLSWINDQRSEKYNNIPLDNVNHYSSKRK